MKCENCGAELREGSVYCMVCGKPVQIVPDYNAFDDEYADYDFDDDYDDEYDDDYDAPTGNTRNLGRSAKKSKTGKKSDDYDVDFIDL